MKWPGTLLLGCHILQYATQADLEREQVETQPRTDDLRGSSAASDPRQTAAIKFELNDALSTKVLGSPLCDLPLGTVSQGERRRPTVGLKCSYLLGHLPQGPRPGVRPSGHNE